MRVHHGVGDAQDVLSQRGDANDLVAQLSAIDNAVLVDANLRLRGFGTQVIEGPTSGAAAAIIASQDARLSLVVKNARGIVEVIGAYERAFGWEC